MVLFVINRDLSLWASHNIFQSNFPTKLIIISSLVLQEKKKNNTGLWDFVFCPLYCKGKMGFCLGHSKIIA